MSKILPGASVYERKGCSSKKQRNVDMGNMRVLATLACSPHSAHLTTQFLASRHFIPSASGNEGGGRGRGAVDNIGDSMTPFVKKIFSGIFSMV